MGLRRSVDGWEASGIGDVEAGGNERPVFAKDWRSKPPRDATVHWGGAFGGIAVHCGDERPAGVFLGVAADGEGDIRRFGRALVISRDGPHATVVLPESEPLEFGLDVLLPDHADVTVIGDGTRHLRLKVNGACGRVRIDVGGPVIAELRGWYDSIDVKLPGGAAGVWLWPGGYADGSIALRLGKGGLLTVPKETSMTLTIPTGWRSLCQGFTDDGCGLSGPASVGSGLRNIVVAGPRGVVRRVQWQKVPFPGRTSELERSEADMLPKLWTEHGASACLDVLDPACGWAAEAEPTGVDRSE